MDYLPNTKNNTRAKSFVVSVAIITNDDMGCFDSYTYKSFPFYQYVQKLSALFLKIAKPTLYNNVKDFLNIVVSPFYLLFTGLYHNLLASDDRGLTLYTHG